MPISESTYRKLLDIQWKDHYQTRTQTWEALKITAIITGAVIGINWSIKDSIIGIISSILIIIISQFGILITLHHRNTEIFKFTIISAIEKQLKLHSFYKRYHINTNIPNIIKWIDIFNIHKSNNPLFMIRIYFVIQLCAIGYILIGLFKK